MQTTVDQATGLIINPTPSILSAAEESDLAEQELIIARNLPDFLAVGNALAHVNKQRLYRAFGTFENYCDQRWGFSGKRAYQLIDGAAMSTVVGNIANERQARALGRLKDPLEQLMALRVAEEAAVKVVPSGKVTTSLIEKAVDSLLEARATGGKVDVDGSMLAVTASVITRHYESVQTHIQDAEEKRGIKNGVVVVVLKASACRVQSVLPNGDVILHFENTADAAKLRAMWMGRAGGNLSLKLTQMTKSVEVVK